MSRLPDLADRIERLLLRHDEQKRTNTLLEQQLRVVSDERDNLRSRLAAARARIDALIDRLPASEGGNAANVASATDSTPTVTTDADASGPRSMQP
jgi:uncharacterized protein (TIGR02449 family)